VSFVLCFISIFLAFDFILRGGMEKEKILSIKLKRIDATKTQSNEAEKNAMKKR
jgi:hypothetical protein